MTECMPQIKKTGHTEKIQDMLKMFVHAQTNRVHLIIMEKTCSVP